MPPEAAGGPIYDTIGLDYANLRKADPRIAAMIEHALGDTRTVLNVGAGTGNYEPQDRAVTALEPSTEMIAQRPASAAPCVQGAAEDLPFDDDSFDGVMGVLTIHHWSDSSRGLREMRRVARGPVVLLTFDPDSRAAWILDYVPQLTDLDLAIMPRLSFYQDVLGPVEIIPVPIAHDCTDGFLYAYWRRPEAYLDPAVRRSISSFWRVAGVETGLERLARDLRSGAWAARYGDLLSQEFFDAGYRLVVSR